MSLKVFVPLTAEEEAALVARASAQGISLDSLLRNAVIQLIASGRCEEPPLTADQADRAFEEMAEMIPEGAPVLSDEAVSRESIYTRENEWRRNPS